MARNDNWALMLTYNCLALTRNAVKSVLAQDIPTTLLVMDDGSTDGSLEYLRSLYPRVRLHACQQAGVSYLWNRGLEYLFDKEGAPYVFCVNNDTEVRPDTIRLLAGDGGLFVTCVGTSSGADFPGGKPSGERRPHPDFSAFLIRRECWEKIGPFDEAMRCYASDGDYHLRMHKAGIEAVSLDLPFYHVASGTLKNAEENERQRILDRAKLDREAFELKWHFSMGSPEYYAAFEKEEVAGCK